MKPCHEKVIGEISQLIVDNLILMYNYNENALPNIRKYCYKNMKHRYKLLDYYDLIGFTHEALHELIRAQHLYDFRDLE